jgi:hypothetical protein
MGTIISFKPAKKLHNISSANASSIREPVHFANAGTCQMNSSPRRPSGKAHGGLYSHGNTFVKSVQFPSWVHFVQRNCGARQHNFSGILGT